MIHTFELSKEITRETFDKIRIQINMDYRREGKTFWTKQFEEQGLQMVRLRKEVKKPSETHYMAYVTVNPGKMFQGDPHLPTDVTVFSPVFAQAIYEKIADALPLLEEYPDVRIAMQKEAQLTNGRDSHYEKWKRLNAVWFQKNAFNANRIDFTYDVSFYPLEYEKLIERGYPLRKRNYLRINIYHKGREITERGLAADPNTDYNFLRLEIQLDKDWLYAEEAKLRKLQLHGCAETQSRELFYLISPEVEEYALTYYIGELTGTGFYVTNSLAMEIIDDSSHTDYEKEKMKAVMKEVRNRHGIAKMLELVENGTITDLGKVSTVKGYLNLIHELGINPVTISDRMNAPVLDFRNSKGDIAFSGKALPNLVDVIKVYSRGIQDKKREWSALLKSELEAGSEPVADNN